MYTSLCYLAIIKEYLICLESIKDFKLIHSQDLCRVFFPKDFNAYECVANIFLHSVQIL